jgi:hypothetical protein
VTIPAEDAALVREVAAVLRTGGDQARRVRQTLRPLVSTGVAKFGSDLVAFFRCSPLVGVELTVERDRSSGREIDL